MLCRDGRVDEAWVIPSCFIKVMLLDIITYTSLLDGYLLRGQMDEAMEVVELMDRNGCKPDVVTFSALLNRYCQRQGVDEALYLFHEMCHRGISPNIVTYNTLIDACARTIRSNSLTSFSRKWKLTDELQILVLMLYRLCKNALIEREDATAIMSKMENKGPVPDIVVYNILIDGLCKAGQLAEAKDVFSCIQAKGLHLRVEQSDLIGREEFVSEAVNEPTLVEIEDLGGKDRALFRKFFENQVWGLVTYVNMVKGLCRIGDNAGALFLLRKMEGMICKPDIVLYTSIIDSLYMDKLLPQGLKVFYEIKSKRDWPEFVTHNSLN